jgi:hypothetical protein
MHTENNDYKASVDRFIEPGIFRVMDVLVNSKGEIKCFSKLGSRLYIDTTMLDKGATDKSINHCKDPIMEQADHGFGFNWPYFSYVSK